MKTYKLHVVIFFSFLALFLIIVTGLVAYGYKSNTKIMLQTSDELLYQISETITKQTSNHLEPAKKIGSVLRQILEQNSDSLAEIISYFQSFSLEALDTYSQFSSIYYGDENGDFIMVRRTSEGKLAIKKIFRSIQPSGGIETELTKERNFIEKRDIGIDYDPRERPWYRLAKTEGNISWSPDYLLYTEQTYGVTCSHPVYKNNVLMGVIGIDFTLKDISSFMKTIKIGNGGTAFICDLEGKLLAYPGQIQVKNTYFKKNIEEMEKKYRSTIQEAIEKYSSTRQMRFTYNHNNERLIAIFRHFPNDIGYNWILGIIVPEIDFIGPISKVHETTMLFACWLFIIASFLTATIAKELARPINQITQEVVHIKNLNFENEYEITSSVTEIQTMIDAVNSMQTVLRSFNKFVPRELIAKLIEEGKEANASVKPEHITLMFTDIESFSAITEKSNPNQLVKQLAEYFDELSSIIYKNNGVIDKYIGDSIMAFWGAPTHDAKQAFNACKAALEIQQKLDELNKKWKSENKPIFKTRIGIHTGVSLVGNFGSSKRLNYTALGDNVNLASRLEGLNKLYKTNIIVSDETKGETGNSYIFRPLDLVTVKGREKSLKIYNLMGIWGEHPEDDKIGRKLYNTMEQALELYVNRKWDAALEKFYEIKRLDPKDYVVTLYIERIKELKENPPGENWNGVYNFKSK